jgi:DNA topoisomerase IB
MSSKAQKLKRVIGEIRKNYHLEMASKHSQFRQRATAIYLIDFLALRVGYVQAASDIS